MSTGQHTGDSHGSYPVLLLACYSVAQEIYAAIEQQQKRSEARPGQVHVTLHHDAADERERLHYRSG